MKCNNILLLFPNIIFLYEIRIIYITLRYLIIIIFGIPFLFYLILPIFSGLLIFNNPFDVVLFFITLYFNYISLEGGGLKVSVI